MICLFPEYLLMSYHIIRLCSIYQEQPSQMSFQFEEGWCANSEEHRELLPVITPFIHGEC